MKTVARDAAWRLLALETVGRRRNPSPVDVISRADAINHDVMNYEKFLNGTGLLLSANLVHRPQAVRLSRKGRELLKACGARDMSVGPCLRPDSSGWQGSPRPARVTARAFDGAVHEYFARHE
jgi:hypothetical protein